MSVAVPNISASSSSVSAVKGKSSHTVMTSKFQSEQSKHSEDLKGSIKTLIPELAIIECGTSTRLVCPPRSSALIKVPTTVMIEDKHKVFLTVISNDDNLGGLSHYLVDVKKTIGEKHFLAFVENSTSVEREISVNYMIL